MDNVDTDLHQTGLDLFHHEVVFRNIYDSKYCVLAQVIHLAHTQRRQIVFKHILSYITFTKSYSISSVCLVFKLHARTAKYDAENTVIRP